MIFLAVPCGRGTGIACGTTERRFTLGWCWFFYRARTWVPKLWSFDHGRVYKMVNKQSGEKHNITEIRPSWFAYTECIDFIMRLVVYWWLMLYTFSAESLYKVLITMAYFNRAVLFNIGACSSLKTSLHTNNVLTCLLNVCSDTLSVIS